MDNFIGIMHAERNKLGISTTFKRLKQSSTKVAGFSYEIFTGNKIGAEEYSRKLNFGKDSWIDSDLFKSLIHYQTKFYKNTTVTGGKIEGWVAAVMKNNGNDLSKIRVIVAYRSNVSEASIARMLFVKFREYLPGTTPAQKQAAADYFASSWIMTHNEL